ncbi:hypothetical protein J2W23_002354 [Variovorax boronicumulans]|uniref:DUF2645 family protein n=1 Tax=Variovorax boronicumulans TaxID=436515 RepID=UPI0027839D18|nr:DUF2645 family protein [Variovorax boronicumulans]MDQ0013972.1 hypothetical protein [Variovorax boronicumulans]
MRKVLLSFGAIYSAFCILVIFGLPKNKYEWMLSDPAMREDALTFCTLPLDDGEGSSEFISFSFLLPFLVAAVALSIRARKIHFFLWVGLGLVAIWLLRFYVFSPRCPGRETF